MRETGWKEKDDYTIKEIRDYMEREQLDAFIPWKSAHIGYLTNYYDLVHINVAWEELTAFLVIPLASDAFVVGAHKHWIGMDDSVKPWWIMERIDPTKGPFPAHEHRILADSVDALKAKGLGKARIGIETKWMPVDVHDYLKAALPEVEFVSADRLVPQIRFIKTRRQQLLLKRAANIGLYSMEAYMQAVRNGATREEAELLKAKCALDHGGEFMGGPYRSGWTGAVDGTLAWWDAAARARFEAGLDGKTWKGVPFDSPFFVTHYHARFQCYFSDLSWHGFYEEPDEDDVFSWGPRQATFAEASRDFAVLRRCQHEAMQTIRPGMSQIEAKRAVDDYLQSDPEVRERVKTYFVHGIGLETHEEPVLTARANPVPLDGPIYYHPGAVCSSEWFSDLWTIGEPFVMTTTGWEPLVELKGLTV